MINLKSFRHTFNTLGDRNIISDMFVNRVYFCHVLEDEIRADGVKVYGMTCIDAGIYDIEVTWSPHFKRDMVLVKNVPRFTGIRMHGGNRSKDTLGCPLVAYNTDYKIIWQSAEAELTALVKAAGGKGTLEIVNAPLSYDRDLKLYQ
jgi:hypothetical protein